MLPHEIAREIIVPAAGNHKLDFVVGPHSVEIGGVECIGFARIGALDVHDFDDRSRQAAYESFAARFDHHCVSSCKQLLSKLGSFGLQQRLAPRDFHQASGGYRLPGKRMDFTDDFVSGVLCPAVKCIRRVAPNAAQVATGQANENAGQTRAGAFALDGLENFSDNHEKPAMKFRRRAFKDETLPPMFPFPRPLRLPAAAPFGIS